VEILYLLHSSIWIMITVFWQMVHYSVLNTHKMVGSSTYLVACCWMAPEYFYQDGPSNYRSGYDGGLWDMSLDIDWIFIAPISVPHKNQKLLVIFSFNYLIQTIRVWVSFWPLPWCGRANTAHYLLHGCHHKHPMDGLRLVFPPAAAAILCFPVNIRPLVLQMRRT
jgi:hypothetical protein